MSTRELVIVGAGALGVATAWRAAEQGADLVILDRGAVCSGTSPRGAGLVNRLLRGPSDVAIVDESIDRFQALDAATGPAFSYHETGGLLVVGPRNLDRVRKLERIWRAQAIRVRELDPFQLADLPGCEGLDLEEDERAYLTERDGWCVTTDAVNAMLTRARDAGAELRTQTPVAAVREGEVELEDEDTIRADRVVLAAGVWSRDLLDTGWSPPLLPYRAQACVLETDGDAPPGPCVHDTPNKTYWRPEGPGKLLVGDGTDLSPQDLEHAPSADPGFAASVRRKVADRWPAAEQASLVRDWAGYEAGTPDAHPLVGHVPGAPGVILCTGGNGFGFMRSPVLGETAAHLALDRAPPIPLPDAEPGRFDPPPELPFEMQEGFALE